MTPKMALSLFVLGAVGVVGANSTFILEETEQAMVLEFGKVKKLVAEPGLHFKTPFVQQLTFFDKRILETDSKPEEIQSKEKEPMVVDSFTRWRIVDAQKFYQTVQSERRARSRLNIIVNSNLRQELARHNSKEIVSGDREEVMAKVLKAARVEAEPLGIEVIDVRIKRADWPANISQAVYARMNAERNKEAKEIRAQGAEKAQEIKARSERDRTILLAEAQRDAQKLRGEGDAESIKISARAFNKDVKFYEFLRSMEAYENSFNDKETLMVLDPSMKFFKYFDKAVK